MIDFKKNKVIFILFVNYQKPVLSHFDFKCFVFSTLFFHSLQNESKGSFTMTIKK